MLNRTVVNCTSPRLLHWTLNGVESLNERPADATLRVDRDTGFQASGAFTRSFLAPPVVPGFRSRRGAEWN